MTTHALHSTITNMIQFSFHIHNHSIQSQNLIHIVTPIPKAKDLRDYTSETLEIFRKFQSDLKEDFNDLKEHFNEIHVTLKIHL